MEFVTVTIPTLSWLLSPSMVTDDPPTVRIPRTLKSPSTIKAVFPYPTWTVPTPLLVIVVTPV